MAKYLFPIYKNFEQSLVLLPDYCCSYDWVDVVLIISPKLSTTPRLTAPSHARRDIICYSDYTDLTD